MENFDPFNCFSLLCHFGLFNQVSYVVEFFPVVVKITSAALALAQREGVSMSPVLGDASFSPTLAQCLIRSGKMRSIFKSFASG